MRKFYPRYFRIVEREAKDKRGKKLMLKYLQDPTGSTWGVFMTYRSAKEAIPILIYKYEDELKLRGVFPEPDKKENENV